jgi:hypothetical protein
MHIPVNFTGHSGAGIGVLFVFDLFYLKLLLAFVIGSLTITLATVAAERLGSKIGGLIGGLPIMIAITLFFIGLAESPQIAAEATDVIPLVVAFNGVFLLVFALLSERGALIAIACGFICWVGLSSIVVLFSIRSFTLSLVANLLISVFCYVIMETRLGLKSSRRIELQYTSRQILSRGLFAGTMVAFAVFMNRLGGPLWGGVFAPFPTVFLATITILAVSKGPQFARMITKPLLVSGMINIVIYAIAVRFSYPAFGLALGTVVSLAISAIAACGTYLLMREWID